MTDVSNELLYEVLKQVQMDVADLKQMRAEMRDGFASMRSHWLPAMATKPSLSAD